MNQSPDRLEALKSMARGESHARMITKDEFLELFELALAEERIVDGFEPFRIEGGYEIAHSELTVTPSWFHERHDSLSWLERVEAMRKIVADTISDIEKTGGEFRFNAWSSKRDDWIN